MKFFVKSVRNITVTRLCVLNICTITAIRKHMFTTVATDWVMKRSEVILCLKQKHITEKDVQVLEGSSTSRIKFHNADL